MHLGCSGRADGYRTSSTPWTQIVINVNTLTYLFTRAIVNINNDPAREAATTSTIETAAIVPLQLTMRPESGWMSRTEVDNDADASLCTSQHCYLTLTGAASRSHIKWVAQIRCVPTPNKINCIQQGSFREVAMEITRRVSSSCHHSLSLCIKPKWINQIRFRSLTMTKTGTGTRAENIEDSHLGFTNHPLKFRVGDALISVLGNNYTIFVGIVFQVSLLLPSLLPHYCHFLFSALFWCLLWQ